MGEGLHVRQIELYGGDESQSISLTCGKWRGNVSRKDHCGVKIVIRFVIKRVGYETFLRGTRRLGVLRIFRITFLRTVCQGHHKVIRVE